MRTLSGRVANVSRLFLDTAPVIYYAEAHPRYLRFVRVVFDRLDQGVLEAITSPITLAECLVGALRQGQAASRRLFSDLITQGNSTRLAPVDAAAGETAAELRAKYNLTLADALQVATALGAACDGFLTNGTGLRRVTEVDVIVLDDTDAP